MDFRQASPRKEAAKKPTKRKSTGAGGEGAQGQINFGAKKSNPISRQRSIQQIQRETEDFDASPWGDTDEDEDYAPDDDPIRVDSDATDVEGDVPLKVAKRKKAGHPQHSAIVDLASASEISRSATVTPTDWAYKELQDVYNRVSTAHPGCVTVHC